MSSTNRRSFLARSAALAAVPAVAALAGGTLTGQASAATLPDAPVLPFGLPLTSRHLTGREKANLAVVLQAYHDGEGDSLNPQGFRDLFAADGVLNGIGDVVA
jgi:predicted ester cyclase